MSNFLIIGCGARESAVLRNLKRVKNNTVFCYIPHEHPDVSKHSDGYCCFENNTIDNYQCLNYCKVNKIKYVFIGSENYINTDLSTFLEANSKNITCICPSKEAAQIETSKYFARNLLENHEILKKFNPGWCCIDLSTSFTKIMDFIKKYNNNIVIKSDGLKSGKGVKVYDVHIFSLQEIIETIYNLFADGETKIILEERIVSDNEFSLFTFTDSINCSHTFPVKDFKRLHFGNNGPNTGSMGCIYDNGTLKYLTPELINEAENINHMVIERMKSINLPFKGILYGSYIVTPTGNLKIIEFNCRLGDPEGVMIMNRMETDFGLVCKSISKKKLSEIDIKYTRSSKYAICKYIVPSTYPLGKNSGFNLKLIDNSYCYHGAIKHYRDFNTYDGTSSRTLVYYSTSNESLELAETQADIYFNAMLKKNPEKLYYRKNISIDYKNEGFFDFNKQEFIIETDSDNSSDEFDVYKNSGVDVNEGNRAVKNIAPLLVDTHDNNVLGEVGGFGGLYDLDYVKSACLNPVLVTSIDGVGTKSIFSVEHFELDGYTMLGCDIVNHCVNDILVQGANPLFFTDYFASSVLNSDELYYFIKGVSKACKEVGCALIGGETAEMPNIYEKGMHDLVGNIVGVVDKHEIIDGKKNVKRGDVMVSMSSSGPHTNGFSLIRKLYKENAVSFDTNMIKTLCNPHRCYLNEFNMLKNNNIDIHGMAHITGGGLRDNIKRVVPDDMEINFQSFEYTEVFQRLQHIGNIPNNEMERVFNCGIGMVFIVSESDANTMLEMFTDSQIIGVIA